MDFHIEFLKSRYSLDAEELRCLARALGYPTSVLTVLFNLSLTGEISISKIITIMEKSEFDEVMQLRFNNYPSEWNKRAILTSIMLLSYKSISFANLSLIRCIFNFYEKEDGSGLTINKSHLLQYIKMCGRIISPLRLSHRLKHMHNRLYCPNRFQLWELLEIILWSDVFNFLDMQNSARLDVEKKNDLYQLADDDISVIYTELKHFENENMKFIQEELTFKKGYFSKVVRIFQKPLRNAVETNETKMSKNETRILSKRLNRTNHKVSVEYASGYKYYLKSEDSNKIESDYSRKDILESGLDLERTEMKTSISKLRPKTAPIVTTEDIQLYNCKMDLCKSDTKVLNSKYKNKLYLDMEYLRPGFWERWNNRIRPHTSICNHVNMITIRKPSQSSIESLSRPRTGLTLSYHRQCLQLK